MTEAKTYRANERGYYHVPGTQGFAIAEEGETFTTDSPHGDWMDEVDAPTEASANDGTPDYTTLKLPDLVRMAVDRGIEIPKDDMKGQQLRKHLVAALEA